jgi:hypothetical protein
VDTGRIILVDGKLPSLPTFHSTAVRVRGLPKYISVPALPGGNNEKTLPLEVTPEPGLPWLGLVSVRVDRAVDEHGQALVQPSLFIAQTLDAFNHYVQQQLIWNGNYYIQQQPWLGNPNHAPIRLRMGEKPANKVKDLEGTVTCQVQSPVEPLITVDNVLKAGGTTTEGVDGSSIKIVDVKRENNGQVKIKLVVQGPGQDLDFGGGFGGRAVRINRAVLQMKVGGMGGNPVANSSLELRDDRGVPFQLLSSNVQQQAQAFMGGAVAMEQEMLFQPHAAQGAPTKLVYLGRRNVMIEVPFSLKDAPLQ